MAVLYRVKVAIAAGGVIGNAFMNWYFTTASATNLTAINTFLTAFKTYLPSGITYTIPASGDAVNEEDGKLAGSWSAGSPSSVIGSSATAHTGQAGATVEWITTATVDGHHPRGRAILVPLTLQAFGTTGQLAAAFQTAATTAGTAFLSSSTGFVVWHRPKYSGKPPNRVLERPGIGIPVSGVSVPFVTSTLRSRNH